MPVADVEEILRAIDNVIARCLQSQEKKPDPVVTKEISALHKIREEVRQQWPLPQNIKSKINIGLVAAKNLSDWNDELANCLMIIDYALTHDGTSLEKLRCSGEPNSVR